jgi:cytochrome oxidase assembly protein ShyY1
VPRRLLTPRWVALTLLAVVLVAACVRLGFWQLDRARAVQDSQRAVADAPTAPLEDVTTPQGDLPGVAVGRSVRVTGEYVPRTFLVAGRTRDGSTGGGSGADGSWVVSVLRTASGAGVVVVRGWVAGTPTPPPAPATGEVTVTGRLASSETPGGDLTPGTTLPADQLPAVDAVDVMRYVDFPLYDGYLVAADQQPPDPAALGPVAPPRAVSQVPGFYGQHLAYVVLWWLFGLFVIAFWVRLLRDDLAEDRPEPAARLTA